jgi:hypothetical protein
MRRLSSFLALVVAVAATAYGLTYYYSASRQPEDQWTWLRREFHLDGAQLVRIKALHEAYQPVCADHCSRIMAARERLAGLDQAGRRNTPDYLATLGEWEAVKRECNEATFRHLQAVAAVMSPAQGRRYLDMMGPRIVRADHIGPLGIR